MSNKETHRGTSIFERKGESEQPKGYDVEIFSETSVVDTAYAYKKWIKANPGIELISVISSDGVIVVTYRKI